MQPVRVIVPADLAGCPFDATGLSSNIILTRHTATPFKRSTDCPPHVCVALCPVLA